MKCFTVPAPGDYQARGLAIVNHRKYDTRLDQPDELTTLPYLWSQIALQSELMETTPVCCSTLVVSVHTGKQKTRLTFLERPRFGVRWTKVEADKGRVRQRSRRTKVKVDKGRGGQRSRRTRAKCKRESACSFRMQMKRLTVHKRSMHV